MEDEHFWLDILWRRSAGVFQEVLVDPEAALELHVKISLRRGIFWDTCIESVKVFKRSGELRRMGFHR